MVFGGEVSQKISPAALFPSPPRYFHFPPKDFSEFTYIMGGKFSKLPPQTLKFLGGKFSKLPPQTLRKWGGEVAYFPPMMGGNLHPCPKGEPVVIGSLVVNQTILMRSKSSQNLKTVWFTQDRGL